MPRVSEEGIVFVPDSTIALGAGSTAAWKARNHTGIHFGTDWLNVSLAFGWQGLGSLQLYYAW